MDFSGSSLSDLVNVVKEAFKDLIDETAQLVLQLKDENWGGVFIDVQDIEVVKDRSVLRVLMQKRNNEKVLKFGLLCCGYIKWFDFFPSQVTVNIACKHQIVMALQKDFLHLQTHHQLPQKPPVCLRKQALNNSG